MTDYIIINSDYLNHNFYKHVEFLDIDTLIIFLNLKNISKTFFKFKKIKNLIIIDTFNNLKIDYNNINYYLNNRKNIIKYNYINVNNYINNNIGG